MTVFQLCNIWRGLHDWIILSFPCSLWSLLVTRLVYLFQVSYFTYHKSDCSFWVFSKTRFQSLGIFQRDFWLPVSHVSVHGQLASFTPRGRPAWTVGDDGDRWEGRAEVPDPRLNGRDACRVAPEPDGRLLHIPSLRCRLLCVFQNPERGLAGQTTENKTKTK